ncbi:hypothetical protein E2C01_040586 [Portunus trituberculatus]|uniref:Uncharacterized protein n=1 Tax=Portunus trituberculatus TaxID=210409 RepID=A0A5B7FMW3_PORTR|nr:hypothetical protein [Portunus trituberculatus]
MWVEVFAWVRGEMGEVREEKRMDESRCKDESLVWNDGDGKEERFDSDVFSSRKYNDDNDISNDNNNATNNNQQQTQWIKEAAAPEENTAIPTTDIVRNYR